MENTLNEKSARHLWNPILNADASAIDKTGIGRYIIRKKLANGPLTSYIEKYDGRITFAHIRGALDVWVAMVGVVMAQDSV